jgi:hypothetical protein
MRPPTNSEENKTQDEDDDKEGKAYDELVEGLFFQPNDDTEE